MVNYVFKSIMEKKELESRKKLGAKYIEIQLEQNFLFMNRDDIKKNVKENIIEGLDVVTVHSPIDWKDNLIYSGTITLASLNNKEQRKLFEKLCYTAQLYSEIYKHDVNIIIHNTIDFEFANLIDGFLSSLVNYFNLIIKNYPNVLINIENVTVPEKGGYFFENVDFVNYFNNVCTEKKFKTVLDICHALSTIRIFKEIKNEKILLKEYFIKNKNVLGTIHLANCKSFGFIKGEHGCGYDKNNIEDVELLKKIIYLIKNYSNDNVLICLEVTEHTGDYYGCPELVKTLECLKLYDK